MSVTTYLGTSSQIWYWSLHVLVLGGSSDLGMYMCIVLYISIDLPLHWYFVIFSYKLTVLNGLSLMTLKSKEFTLCSGSFEWGYIISFTLVKLKFPYIFLLVDCFQWAVIDDTEN